MMDIRMDLHVVHPCRTLQVAAWGIVEFQYANSEPADEEGLLAWMALVSHFAEGRMTLGFAETLGYR